MSIQADDRFAVLYSADEPVTILGTFIELVMMEPTSKLLTYFWGKRKIFEPENRIALAPDEILSAFIELQKISRVVSVRFPIMDPPLLFICTLRIVAVLTLLNIALPVTFTVLVLKFCRKSVTVSRRLVTMSLPTKRLVLNDLLGAYIVPFAPVLEIIQKLDTLDWPPGKATE